LKVPIPIGTSEGERAFIGVREVVAVVASMREELDHPIFTYSRAPRSTQVTPLRRYYGPILHPLAFDRFPGLAGYTIYLDPRAEPLCQWVFEEFRVTLSRRRPR
jgi:hypothetical protein